VTDDGSQAFADFMRAEQRALLGLAGALTGDRPAAEDVVADVLGRVWEQWDRVSGAERPGAYARRMVVNEFLTRKRRGRRLMLTAHFEEHSLVGADHASLLAERDALRSRLAKLPARQRTAVVLRYYADLPDSEIATLLGCSLGTVRSLVSRALATLRVHHDPPSDRPETDSPTTASDLVPTSTMMNQETA
jgi:RNA polymerase sigma-70 factor (sigma-E family)